MNTYTKNLETGKLELHFEKSTYMALSDELKKEIKSNFLWSNYAGGWVSRAKEPNTYRAEQVAKKLNLTFEGETGEKLSFSEQVEREQEKASHRAERMESRADKAEQESATRYQAAKQIGSFIPLGQPILVGHHSEGRHRRDLAKIDNNMRKSVEADDKANYYSNRAKSAENTANGEKFKSVDYLLNRIDDCNKALRAIDRGFKGIIDNERHQYLEARKAEENEKLTFFTAKLQEIGGGQLTAERLKESKPKYVKVNKKWYPLKSINRDTVTVLNWIYAKGTWKFKFDLIKELGTTNIKVYDRDNNEVLPTIKY